MLQIVPRSKGPFILNGEKTRKLRGRTSFKMGMWIANGDKRKAEQWVELNQRLFGQHCVFRVFMETAGWGYVDPDMGMFGSPPQDPGIWDLAKLRDGDLEQR